MASKIIGVILVLSLVVLGEALAFKAGELGVYIRERTRVPIKMDSEPILSPITVRYLEDRFGGHVEVYRLFGGRPELIYQQHVWKYVD